MPRRVRRGADGQRPPCPAGNAFSQSLSASDFLRFNVAQCHDPRIFEVLSRVLLNESPRARRCIVLSAWTGIWDSIYSENETIGYFRPFNFDRRAPMQHDSRLLRPS